MEAPRTTDPRRFPFVEHVGILFQSVEWLKEWPLVEATLIAATVGCIAGGSHVVSGPDHLAAIAPLTSTGRPGSRWVGVCWGLGHSVGVWLLALLALQLRETTTAHFLSDVSERLVGVMLIVIGLWGVWRLRQQHEAHEPERNGHDERSSVRHTDAGKALTIGLVHGVAGGAHLVGILPALALPRPAAFAYTLGYGFGGILAMALASLGLWLLAHHTRHRSRLAGRVLGVSLSCMSIGVGFFWLVFGPV